MWCKYSFTMTRVTWKPKSFVHVYNRGGRGMPIVKDEADRRRFIRMLYYLNDENSPSHWERRVKQYKDGFHFQRPDTWAARNTHVDISAYCLMNNHYHLLLYEHQQGGISKFMQRVNSSMANHFSKKYDESGLFAGSYKSRVIESDDYLRALFFYINIKNPFETYPGGYESAIHDFESAFRHALEYQYCSLFEYHHGGNGWPIVNKDRTREFIDTNDLKAVAKDFMASRNIFRKEDAELQHTLIDDE